MTRMVGSCMRTDGARPVVAIRNRMVVRRWSARRRMIATRTSGVRMVHRTAPGRRRGVDAVRNAAGMHRVRRLTVGRWGPVVLLLVGSSVVMLVLWRTSR